MDFLWDKITEWLKEMLIGGIESPATFLLHLRKSMELCQKIIERPAESNRCFAYPK